jgi:multicomponent Na+:H+ antiporter subunit D
MVAITLNPGFVLILTALLALAAPRSVRAPAMAGAALVALWLLLDHQFGAAAAVAQMGLPVVLLNLDALNRIFGIAALIALIALAIFANARANRYEDAAILMMAGGAVSALFVGDLVSFVAASSLAGLAAAWIVFCSPIEGANRAGVRLLVWNGLEGLLLLVGVAFHLSGGAAGTVYARLDIASIGGGCIFAALMIRVGAPLLHIWVKDTIAHASPLGGAALSAFATMIGVYALARFFPAEPLLMPIGAAMIVIGALYAATVDDLRAAGAYGLMTQTGLCVALIGVGSPLAVAAAEGHVFTAMFVFTALQMVLGAVLARRGAARLSQFEGLARSMPITTALLLVTGLAAAGVPGLALYATHAVALEATAQWELRWLWALIAAGSAVLFASLALRPALAAHRHGGKPARFHEAPFSMLLGAAVAAFFCVSIGLAPDWLYGLMPTALTFAPFALDRVAPQLELLGAAGAAYVVLRALGLAPKERAIDLLDIDAFYRGPVSGAARWAGVVMLRVYGAWGAAVALLAERAADAMGAWTRSCDTPYLGRGWAALQIWAIGLMAVIMLISVQA